MHPVIIPFPAGNGLLTNESGCVLFFSAVEVGGTATAEFQLWDNTSPTGLLVVDVTLTPQQSTREYIHKHHLPFKTGLWYQVVSGSLRGSVSVLLGCVCGHRDLILEFTTPTLPAAL